MRELFILLKYSSKNKERRKESRILGSNYSIFLFQYVLFSFIAGFLYFRMLSVFNIEFGGIRFADIISGLYIIIFTFLFLFNYTPFISINLYDNQFIPFFLTLPVKKSTIFFHSALETLIYSGFSIAFILPFSIVYPIIYKTNILLSILAFLLFAIILISIANIIGIILALFISKTTSILLGTISYLFVFIGFFFFSSREFISPERFSNILGLLRLKKILYFPFSPLAWYLNVVNGNYFYIIYLLLFSIIISYISLKIPLNLDFSIARKRLSKKDITIKSFRFLSPLIKKDLNFLRRDASSTYLLIFAIVYPLFLYFTSKNPYSFIMVFAALNSFYCAIVSVNLYAQEKRVLPLPKIYPVKEEEIIRTKFFIPTFIFFLIFVLISLFLIKKTRVLIFFSPVIFVLNIFDSLLSLFFLTRKPDRNYFQKNVLHASEFLFIEIISIIITAIIVLLPTLYAQHLNGTLKLGLITWAEKFPFLLYLIFIFLPLFTFILIIYFSFRMFKYVRL